MARKFQTSITIEDLASAASQALGTKVASDTDFRLTLDAGGKLVWGSGSATGDTNLYRSGADTLKTDDAFVAAGGVVTLTSTGAPSATLDDGGLAIDTSSNTLYIRSGGSWIATGGSGATVGASAPPSPNVGDIWFESDTGDIFVYYDSVWVDVGGTSVANIAMSDTAPTQPANGDFWFETDTARTFVYYNDGTSSQWIEVGAVSAAAAGGEGYIQYYESGSFGGASALTWSAASASLDVIGTVSASEGVITLTTSGAPTSTVADGALAVDTTNDTIYIRSNGAWVESSGGASVTVSDVAPTGPEVGDLWYKSDVGTTLVYYDSAWVEITGSGSSSAYKLTSSSRDAALFIMEIGP